MTWHDLRLARSIWLHRLQWLFLALIRELSTYLRRNCFSMFVYYEMLFKIVGTALYGKSRDNHYRL